MDKNEKYFKIYYLLEKLSKIFMLLFCLDTAFTLIVFLTFIFTNNITYLFLGGGSIPFAFIFNGMDTLCIRKMRKLSDDFIDFTEEGLPDTKEEMIEILDQQKETVEVYQYASNEEIENDLVIPMEQKEIYERPKILTKKYKKK